MNITPFHAPRIAALIAFVVAGVLALAVLVPSVSAASYGSVQIDVVVSGGSADPSDFKLSIKKDGEPSSGRTTGSGNTVIFGRLTPGMYTVNQTGPSGYGATWGGDCDANGNVTVSENSTAHCTVTNTFGGSDDGDRNEERPTRSERTRR